MDYNYFSNRLSVRCPESISKGKMEGACLKLENPIGDAISRIRFAPLSNNLLISSWDATLRLYDVDNSLLRLEIPLEVALLGCCFQDESAAFTIASDCCVRRHDLGSGIHSILGNHGDLVTCLEYSHETSQTITAGLDKMIISWDTREANGIGFSKAMNKVVESMSICGLYLILACETSVYVYDLRNIKRPVQTKDCCMDYQIKCVQSFPDCKGYAVGSIDGRVALDFFCQTDANELSYMFRCHPKSKDGRNHLASVNAIVFHPSRYSAFVTGDNEGYAIMWDARSRKRLFELPRYQSSVASISYNSGGQHLAVASGHTYQEANEIEEHPQIYIHTEE